MALIICPSCGKEISDKSNTCIHCGFDLSDLKKNAANVCPECGTELEEGAEVCPNCGCPIEKAEEKIEPEGTSPSEVIEKDEEQPPAQTPGNRKKRRKGLIAVIIIVIAAVVAIAVGVGVHSSVQKQKTIQASEEYAADLSLVSYEMLEGASKAESAGNLIKNVWNNSIFEKSDSTTDPYTKNSSGKFYDDFNTALVSLFSDADFMEDIATIEEEQNSISSKIKEMQNPPEEWAEAYNALLDYYDAYNTLVNLAVNPTGSLQTYSSNFNDADSAVVSAYQRMDLYLE